MNKQIRQAIEERKPMEWVWEALNGESPLERFQLRAYNGHAETGREYTRRIFVSMSEVHAEQVHRAMMEAGVPEVGTHAEGGLRRAYVVGNPVAAMNAAVKIRRLAG